ncbi:hypothetical protein D3C76_732670 [compost metagenome]
MADRLCAGQSAPGRGFARHATAVAGTLAQPGIGDGAGGARPALHPGRIGAVPEKPTWRYLPGRCPPHARADRWLGGGPATALCQPQEEPPRPGQAGADSRYPGIHRVLRGGSARADVGDRPAVAAVHGGVQPLLRQPVRRADRQFRGARRRHGAAGPHGKRQPVPDPSRRQRPGDLVPPASAAP